MMKRKRRTTRRKTTTKRKPIGYTKVTGGYKLVFGSKKKPRLGKSKYKNKTTLIKNARKYF